MRRTSLALAVLAGCAAVRGPELDPKEHVRGEHQRVLQEPIERLWPEIVDALPAEGLHVAHADRARGVIATSALRLAGREVPKRLAEIGDLARARSAGLQRVSELAVTYYLLLAPRGDAGTSLRIRSAIEAIDRSDSLFLGAGVFQVVPRHFDVPSRGVVERELMRRLVGGLFSAEETLFVLGEPGVD
ncbi:MAG TPA: hypothetical protein VEM57_11345 [Candidatus Binatus sp.]|nr:hypothetical protein [Candidatus Binatus sp.]